MEKLRPVPRQTPGYPGFHSHKRLMRQLALFLRMEVTLPICLFFTLSCAQLHAETASTLPSEPTVVNDQVQTPSENIGVAFDPATAESPCLGNVQEAPPPCRGDVAEPPVKRQPPMPSPSQPTITEAPCSGKMAPPPTSVDPQTSPCTGESAAPPPDSCTGFAPEPQTPDNVPCTGAPPAQHQKVEVVLPASSYKDLSLVDVQKKPGDYAGMRIRLQGFVGNNPPGTPAFSGYYLSPDLPGEKTSDSSEMQLLGSLPPLEVGGRAIVEGMIVRVDSSRSQVPSYAIQVLNIRTK
ncbi:MAG: hypothetical protein WA705_11765 [Candidatus Ozemobacteraceae bacterium]